MNKGNTNAVKFVFSEKEKEEIIKLHKEGMALKKIGEKCGSGFKPIIRVLKKEGEYIIRQSPNYRRGRICNHNFFDIIDTEEKAYWLGFIVADGHNGEDKKYISISSHKKDLEHIELFRKTLRSDHSITIDKKWQCVVISIYSKQLSQTLSGYNIHHRKTYDMDGKVLGHIPDAFIHHFIRGYFDGDGCWYVNKKNYNAVEFGMTGNENFLLPVQKILMTKCNLSLTKMKSKKGTFAKTVIYCGNKQAKKIAHFLYDGATVFLERKKEKVSHLL